MIQPRKTERVRTSSTRLEVPKTGVMLVPARIYVSPVLEATIDEGAIDQAARVATLPGIVGASLAMPDAHSGYGFPIGGVAAFDAKTGIISPGGIGFDINCGVRLLTTNIDAEDARAVMDVYLDALSREVPVGMGRDSKIALSMQDLDDILVQGAQWALARGLGAPEDLVRTEERGCLAGANPNAVSARAKERGLTQLGTLGSGNHFLELQRVERILDPQRAAAYGLREGQLCILIHCGSRGVGHQICSDFLRAMDDAYPELMDALPEKNLLYAPIASELGVQYRAAMAAAANYAWCNRQVIAHNVRAVTQRLFPSAVVQQLYDVSHNIAKFESYEVDGVMRDLCVHRKGATRAFGPGNLEITEELRAHGQPVLIPGSMGTASWVLAGAAGAMTETFGSCCHGAGRAMSRTRALEELDGATVKRELAELGVHVKTPSVKGLAEEAPQAYKDVDEVIRVVAEAGIAVPVARLVPLGVLKG